MEEEDLLLLVEVDEPCLVLDEDEGSKSSSSSDSWLEQRSIHSSISIESISIESGREYFRDQLLLSGIYIYNGRIRSVVFTV